MRSAAHNFAVVQHENLIGMADRSGSLRDQNERLQPLLGRQSLAELGVGGIIQGAGCII